MIKSYIKSSSGAMSIEYALIAALVSLAGLKSVHCITIYCLVPVFADMSAFFQAVGA